MILSAAYSLACRSRVSPGKLKAGCGEFLEREIEKSLVIGFEDYLTAGSKQFFIYFKEAAIGQPSLVISLFRPRIGEVQIYPGYRTVRKKILQAGSIGVYQPYVLYISAFSFSAASRITSEIFSIATKFRPDIFSHSRE